MEYITVVIEYADGQEMPSFTANMELLGGHITAVQFNDALEEVEKLKDQFNNRAGSFYVAQICQLERKVNRYKDALENIAATTIPELDYTFEEVQIVAKEALSECL